MPCVSVVVSGDFCRFKLALPSLLSMSKDVFILLAGAFVRSSWLLELLAYPVTLEGHTAEVSIFCL